jgi:hypothetical protein
MIVDLQPQEFTRLINNKIRFLQQDFMIIYHFGLLFLWVVQILLLQSIGLAFLWVGIQLEGFVKGIIQ